MRNQLLHRLLNIIMIFYNNVFIVIFLHFGITAAIISLFFIARPGGEATRLDCPKIVLDHVHVYIYLLVHFAFPHCWLYTML